MKGFIQKVGIFALCMIMMSLAVTPSYAMAKSSKRVLSYNGKSYTYTKSAVNISVNGKKVTTPFGGVILDNIALVPAYQTYKKSSLNVQYTYDSKSKKLTLENLDHVVEFPIGKKYAYVDGKKSKIEYAAMFIKDKQTGKTCLMLPGRSSATLLGYSYTWNNSKVTSDISEKQEHTEEMEENTSDETKEDMTDSSNDFNAQDEVQDNQGSDEALGQYEVKIPKPDSLSSYDTEDNYWEKKYTITLDNDYSDFYLNNEIIQQSDVVTNVMVDTNDDGNTEIVLQTSKIQAFRIEEKEDALYIEVKNPKEMYDKVIVIDAGHGGTDPGASGNGITEKNKTLEITKAVKQYFDQDDSFKVYYTRVEDTAPAMTAGSDGIKNASMSLAPRYNLANAVQADLFISIHVNSWKESSATGTETLYSPKNTNKNAWGITSKQFAQTMQRAMVDVIGRKDRGAKSRNNLAVLNNTKMPAILIETAFATNKQDANCLNTKVDEIAEAIYTITAQAFK